MFLEMLWIIDNNFVDLLHIKRVRIGKQENQPAAMVKNILEQVLCPTKKTCRNRILIVIYQKISAVLVNFRKLY